MELGCVEDQPQRLQGLEFLGNSCLLRLVKDDTAALGIFKNTL